MLVLACLLETCLDGAQVWAFLALGIMFSQSFSNLHVCIPYSLMSNRQPSIFTAADTWPKMGFSATGYV